MMNALSRTTARAIADVSLSELKGVVESVKLKDLLPWGRTPLGKPEFDAQSMFLGYVLYLRENYRYATVLERKLKENPTFQEFCDFSSKTIPAHDSFSRFFKDLTTPVLREIINRLDFRLHRFHIFDQDNLAIDATDILSNGRNRHTLDPEAGWGYKSDTECFHGYWAIFLVGTHSEMIRDVEVTAANIHQSVTAQVLLERLTAYRRHNAYLCCADSAYDDRKTYSQIIENEMVPIISYNPKKAKIKNFLNLKPNNWRYKSLGQEGVRLWRDSRGERGGVERYNSTFKELLVGRTTPVRGLQRVTNYVLGVVILSQLCALAVATRDCDDSLCYQKSLDDFLTWNNNCQDLTDAIMA